MRGASYLHECFACLPCQSQPRHAAVPAGPAVACAQQTRWASHGPSCPVRVTGFVPADRRLWGEPEPTCWGWALKWGRCWPSPCPVQAPPWRGRPQRPPRPLCSLADIGPRAQRGGQCGSHNNKFWHLGLVYSTGSSSWTHILCF